VQKPFNSIFFSPQHYQRHTLLGCTTKMGAATTSTGSQPGSLIWRVRLRVPPAATAIASPLNIKNWSRLLSNHPNRLLVEFFIDGIANGFRIGFKQQSKPLWSAKRNLTCTLQHLTEDISAGPFPSSSVTFAYVSWFGVIPKSHQPNKWRLIVDLSHPSRGSTTFAVTPLGDLNASSPSNQETAIIYKYSIGSSKP